MPYKAGISPNILLLMTTLMGLLVAFYIFIVAGVALHYHPAETWKDYKWMGLIPISLVPILLLFTANYLSNKIWTLLLLIIAALIGLFLGVGGLWSMTQKPQGGDLVGVFLVIFCLLIFLTSLKISKKQVNPVLK